MSWAEKILLIELLMAATCQDFLTEHIPNGLILAGLCCSICTCLAVRDPLLMWDRFCGTLLPLLCLYLLWHLGMMGAGDVKLLMMCGSFFGCRGSLRCLFFSLCWGGLIALLIMLRRKNMRQRFSGLADWIGKSMQRAQIQPYLPYHDQGGRMHFALSVLLGAVSVFWGKGW